MDILEGLNPAQREAVTHGDGPLLVVAGAGTGKTRTLACRVAYLIEQGVAPDRILLLTFTRRAAAEMLHRADELIVGSAGGKVWGGTFHATANRLLRIYGEAIGLVPDFTVVDQGDAADLFPQYDRQRRTMAKKYVQAQSIQNKELLQASDMDERRKKLDALGAIAADKERCHDYLLKSSLIAMVREANATP